MILCSGVTIELPTVDGGSTTYGAMKINKKKFLAALALMRLMRFSAESLLALRYGRRMIGWMKSGNVETVVWAFTILVVAGSFFSAYRLFKKSRK